MHDARKRSRSLLILILCAACGCGVSKSNPSGSPGRCRPTSLVSLEGAKIEALSLRLASGQQHICPREEVQVAIEVSAVLKGAAAPDRFQTWQGRECVEVSGLLDFSQFELTGTHGSFGKDGWFHPDPDLLATAAEAFTLSVGYKAKSATASFPPDYGCIRQAGGVGKMGVSGSAGRDGGDGPSGGGAGAAGGSGGPGGPGQAGSRILASVTLVKTPFHERLLALKLSGEVIDLLLAPAGSFELLSRGGAGGDGGRGGRGGDGGSGRPGGPGGSGGPGGPGGNGGNGGNGGTIELIYDRRFPELGMDIQLSTSGGSGGGGGAGGSGGGRGSGTPNGAPGVDGVQGSRGVAGAPGGASRTPGDVAAQFMGLKGIELLQ